MLTFLKRWRRELEDRLRYDSLCRRALSRLTAWRAAWARRRTPQERANVVARLCAAARLAVSDSTIEGLQAKIRREVGQLDQAAVDLRPFAMQIDKNWMIKAAILKPNLGPREKGVLFISFEGMWAKL